MKRNVSRFFALFLSVSMAVASLTGCGKQSAEVEQIQLADESVPLGANDTAMDEDNAVTKQEKDEKKEEKQTEKEAKKEEKKTEKAEKKATKASTNKNKVTQTVTPLPGISDIWGGNDDEDNNQDDNNVIAVPTLIPAVTVAPTATPEPTVTVAPTVTPEPIVTVAPTVTPESTVTVTPTVIPESTTTPTPTAIPEPTVTPGPVVSIMPTDEYELIWSDEFSGTSLNRSDWNVELHEAGWVNAELQKYVDSDENIYIEDGNLVLKPIKTVDASGKATYTSGRVNTQNKHDFTYGYFEARAKVPTGMGYLPAFWMMPTDENLYGQWPRCGEIDIMEVMGQNTEKAYGTIHFGNPHDERQGTKIISSDNFSDEYHTFAVDWEPGKITWYIDGEEYYSTRDWHTTTVGQGTIAYPAPFDQPFYMILNLAVGGSWVGNPDETTTFEDQQYTIDYVRVYQRKDGYSEEGVTKPEKVVGVLKKADATGNFVSNSSFAESDPLDGSKYYEYMNGPGGVGHASITATNAFDGVNAVKIETTNAGSQDYSIQFVQPDLPMVQGTTYKVSFDAYAENKARAEKDYVRTMIVDISGPDHNYERYFNDTKLQLKAEPQHYEYTFDMKADTDANGRLEFNLGNQNSTATVYITNIRVEAVGTFEIDTTKGALSDGNYIYNGAFQEGVGRMEYWEVVDANSKASYKVTSLDDGRRFEVTTSGCANVSEVKLVQNDIPVKSGDVYAFTFDAKMSAGQAITVKLLGQEYEFTATKSGINEFSKIVTATDVKTVEFLLGLNDTVSVDNVRLVENALIKNGSFNAGLSGYEVYAYTSSNVAYTVDSMSEDNAFDITINDTGDQDWHIQLKQNNVELEKDQWYRFQFDVKSSIERKIMYALQRDGSKHNDDWTPYCQDKVDAGGEYVHVDKIFKMTEPSDSETVLSISMGAVNGIQVSEQHRVCIDNLVLEKIDEPVIELEPLVVGVNQFKGIDFVNFSENWENVKGGGADYDFAVANGKLVYDITSLGTEDWNVQLKQLGLDVRKGDKYLLAFDVDSTCDRTIKTQVMSTGYNWYFGGDINLTADKTNSVEIVAYMDKDTDQNAFFSISMGQLENAAVGQLKFYNFRLEKVADDTETKCAVTTKALEGDDESDDSEKNESEGSSFAANEIGLNLLANSDFTNGTSDWNLGVVAPGEATMSVQDGTLVVDVTNAGTADWNIQLTQSGVKLRQGEKYRLTFNLNSTTARKINGCVLDANNGYMYYIGGDIDVEANTDATASFERTIDEPSCDNLRFGITLGQYGSTEPGVVTISNLSLVRIE